jgi:hypothetical protein
MTTMEQAVLGPETVDMPTQPTAGFVDHGMPTIVRHDILATTANGTEVHLNDPVVRYTRPEAQLPQAEAEPETVQAIGGIGVGDEVSMSLVNYSSQDTRTPEQRLETAQARYGGGKADMTRFIQERNTRRVRAGEPYSVVTALTHGYLPGFRRR